MRALVRLLGRDRACLDRATHEFEQQYVRSGIHQNDAKTKLEHVIFGLASTSDSWTAGPEQGVPLGCCPVCTPPRQSGGQAGDAVTHAATIRFAARTYFRCPDTGLLFALPFHPRRAAYEQAYFTAEYRAQYGRTYLEDFANIARAGRERLKHIRALVRPPCMLLDVGCAYGPFLSVASETGYRVTGVDLSSDAVAYVRSALGIQAVQGDFTAMDLDSLRELSPRCITMWYVVEHFPRVGEALRRANALLPLGGVLALSTPNGSGLSARRCRRAFLDSSPPDHYSVWSPAAARRVLARFGFAALRVRITGHHPERSRLLEPLPRAAGRAASRLLRLGDTFEVYAVKVSAPGEG